MTKRLIFNINWHFEPKPPHPFLGTEAFMVGMDYNYLPVAWYHRAWGYWIG